MIEVNKECKEMRRKWENRIQEVEEKVKEIVEQIWEIKEAIKEIKEEIKERGESSSREEDSERSMGSMNGMSSRWGSEWSLSTRGSGLSQKDIDKLRSTMEERERMERSKNIAIKGIDVNKGKGEINNSWIEKFFKEAIEVEVKVIKCRISGKVIIATIEREEMKEEIMKKKSRLGGRRLLIEHDLTGEERKKQEKIHQWIKEEREICKNRICEGQN